MTWRGLFSSRLLVAVMTLLMVMYGAPAEAWKVRIEGEQIRMNVGAKEGDAVISALKRHNLIDSSLHRGPAYNAALKRLGQRMRGAAVILREHPGGYVIGTISDVEDLNTLGLPVRIVGRYCHSACTLFLGAREVCVSPDTVFGFHQPRKAGGKVQISAAELRASIGKLADHYRPGLREWWMNKGSRSKDIITMTGRELTRFGYQLC
jgi:hypothetical protein